MPVNRLRGDSQQVPQIATHVVGGTPANAQVYTLTCNLKTASYTATGADSNISIATALVLALNNCAIPEITEANFSSGGTATITSQSATGGTPYTFGTSATGTGTFVTTITQNSSGANHADDPKNWSLGYIPQSECSPPVQAAATHAVAAGGLTDGTTYYWVITATNANGESLKSNQQSVAISTPNLEATLSWAAVVGATGYKVYRSTTTNVYTPTALAATLGNVLTYTDVGAGLSAGAAPSSNTALGDDVDLTQTSTPLWYGLPSDHRVWNSLSIDTTYSGQGGLPDYDANGKYYEYRQTHLMVAPHNVYFGVNGGTSSGGGGCNLFRIDKGSATSVAFVVYQTGNPATQGLSALEVVGNNAADSYVLQQGYVGLAPNAGDAAGFANLQLGYNGNPAGDVQLVIGAGCVCGAISQLGGSVNCSGNVASLTMSSGNKGTFSLNGTATMGTLLIEGGTYTPKTTGTHTAVTVADGGTLDHSSDGRAFVITTLTLNDGCTLLDPSGKINATGTNPLTYNGNQKNMNLDFGANQTWTRNS